MYRYLGALSLMLLLGCTGQAPSTADTGTAQEKSSMDCIPGEGLPGGWQRQSEIGDEARAALETVLKQMNSAAKLKSIREVRTQVVAGINFAIEFELDNGEVWHTKVFRDLKGSYSMAEVATRGPLLPFCPK